VAVETIGNWYGIVGFSDENELLEAVSRFHHIPTVIVHGRNILCRVEGAVGLASMWPEADVVIVPAAGLSAMDPVRAGGSSGLWPLSHRTRSRDRSRGNGR
jgi:hypothetical protein